MNNTKSKDIDWLKQKYFGLHFSKLLTLLQSYESQIKQRFFKTEKININQRKHKW